jgi:GT2 family glycosyltransferase
MAPGRPSRGVGSEAVATGLARDALRQGLDALAANDRTNALRWLERAHRILPHDPSAALALAGACLADDPARAASLFGQVADRYDARQAWLGLAVARLRLFGPEDAARPLATALSRHALAPDTEDLAGAIGLATGPGWCALRSDGRLEIQPRDAGKIFVRLDGKGVRGVTLPARWRRGRLIDVRIGDTPLLGSPIDVAAIRRIAGCVEADDHGIRGWAWHPGDPEVPPILTIRAQGSASCKTIIVHDQSMTAPEAGPLARPRSFQVRRDELPTGSGLVRVLGQDGRDLPGSPLWPCTDAVLQAAETCRFGINGTEAYHSNIRRPAKAFPESNDRAGRAPFRCADAAIGSATARSRHRRPPARIAEPLGCKPLVAIVIPVHDGGPVVLACLNSVLRTVPPRTRVVVVDDGSSDPDLVGILDNLARRRKLILLRHPRPLGFPASANAGMQAAGDHDIILLNSDTLVPADWVLRLRAAACSARDIGTVTPFSNDASILSYPNRNGGNPILDQDNVNRLDRIVHRANGSGVADIPVGVGFCLYIRRDCLNDAGPFRPDLFAQGYGEENDFCRRARRLGWRNVALTGLFIGHVGSTSFGGVAAPLRARNSRLVERCHPGHDALIQQFLAADPLAAARRRADRLRWQERGRQWRQAAILITHQEGGGIEQRVISAAEQHAQAGRRPIILRPADTACGEPGVVVHDGITDDFSNLIYAMPRELPALRALLRAARPAMVEVHHLALHPPAVYDLIAQLDVACTVHVHDYAWFCPRISLVDAQDRYCGEPALAGCEACVAGNGHFLREEISVADLRARSAAFLSAARRVVVPVDDTATRMRRYFPALETITEPHEDDLNLVPAMPAVRRHRGQVGGRSTICVPGAIGVHKGFNVLLACARDAQQRGLDLQFVVVGHTIDDATIMATNHVFVTGPFEAREAAFLIARQDACLGFIPSICPETWCLGLSEIWRAGLVAAAFDIGAPAERIRRTGQGFLLPLGLSAPATNDALLAAALRQHDGDRCRVFPVPADRTGQPGMSISFCNDQINA